MLLDALCVLSNAQAPTTGTTASTNVMDFEVANPDQGPGNPLWIRCMVEALFANGTSIQAVLQDSADNSSWATILSGPLVLTAAAIAGKRLLETPLPSKHRRYLRLAYIIDGTMNAGSINASIGPEVQAHAS